MFNETLKDLDIYIPDIKRVVYSDPVTVVIWEDNTKTMSRCEDGDVYDELTGFMLCVFKKALPPKVMRDIFEEYVYDVESKKIKWDSYPTWLEDELIGEDIVRGTLDDMTLYDAIRELMHETRNGGYREYAL